MKVIWRINNGGLHFMAKIEGDDGLVSTQDRKQSWIEVEYTAFGRRQWHPTPALLPGKSHGRRSLVGCSPCGPEESDTTERFHFHFSLSTFMHLRRKWQPTPVFLPGESQGWGSQRAAVYGVAQSLTRLKRLNSSSSSSIQPLKLNSLDYFPA